jgi:hypothetical protein
MPALLGKDSWISLRGQLGCAFPATAFGNLVSKPLFLGLARGRPMAVKPPESLEATRR